MDGGKPEVFAISQRSGSRVISQELPAAQQHTLSLDGQQPGIYIIRVVQGDRVGVERLVKRM